MTGAPFSAVFPLPSGPEHGGPHTRSYVSWAPEPPSELDIPTWLPIFIDGVREYDEPYRFLAIRGSEELMLKAGDTWVLPPGRRG